MRDEHQAALLADGTDSVLRGKTFANRLLQKQADDLALARLDLFRDDDVERGVSANGERAIDVVVIADRYAIDTGALVATDERGDGRERITGEVRMRMEISLHE